MEHQHYAIVATNTIAITEYTHRLLEICIVRRTADRVVGTFTSLVNPRCVIPNEITELTGIDSDVVRFEPVFCEIAEALLDILDGAILVSTNARHDYGVLRREFKTIGYKFTSATICTSKLAEKVISSLKNSQLDEIFKHFAIASKNLNRAEGKARATKKLFKILTADKKRVQDDTYQHLVEQAVHYGMDRLNLKSLERKAGVYYFKDKNDNILYIGKAVRVRDRVRSHFTDKSAKEQSLCSATSKIDFEYTGSNLIAELLEAEEISAHKPTFNTAQKTSTTPFIIVSTENKSGYVQLSIIRKDYSDSVNEVFYNRTSVAEKLMEVCSLFNLCPKYCGFHRVRGKCNHDTVPECPGACIGEVAVQEYNGRVNLALAFLGADLRNFAVKLKGRTIGEMGFVLVRNGVYLGFGFVGPGDQVASLDDFENYILNKKHSYHTTRIIDSYIRKPRNKANIIHFNLE